MKHRNYVPTRSRHKGRRIPMAELVRRIIMPASTQDGPKERPTPIRLGDPVDMPEAKQ